MRQETKILTFAKYNELNEEQKLKVLENYHDLNVDHEWCELTYDDIERQLEILGFSDIKINFTGFWSQGDGASFTAKFSVPETKHEMNKRIKAFKEYSPEDKLFNFETLTFLKEDKGTEIEIYRINHRYYHYNTVNCNHGGLREFCREFSKDIYKRLEKDYEYLTSRKAIEETIEANDYEFNLETLKLA